MSDPISPIGVEQMNIKVLKERALLYRSITICIWVVMVVIATGVWIGLRIKFRVDAVASSITDTANTVRTSIDELSKELVTASTQQRDAQTREIQMAIEELKAQREERLQARDQERQSVAARALPDTSVDLVRSRFGNSASQPAAEPAPVVVKPTGISNEERVAREERIRRFREDAEAKRLAATNAPSIQ